ncbi:hypothetical protein ACODNH_01925 (plasmid) [Haloarcula sp. NS06]|uniref:hypothetical protein n=1 Tax=Haloarcula sp. NS06 TaxID=3409688 RepID=UPI003DA715D9
MTKNENSTEPPDPPLDLSFPSRSRYVDTYGEDFVDVINDTLDRTAPVRDHRFYNVVQAYCRIDDDQVKMKDGRSRPKKKHEKATEKVADEHDLSTATIREICRDHYECLSPTEQLVNDLERIASEINSEE